MKIWLKAWELLALMSCWDDLGRFIGSQQQEASEAGTKSGKTWKKTSWFSKIWIWATENSENCGEFWRHGSHVDNCFLKIDGVYPHISSHISGGNVSIPTRYWQLRQPSAEVYLSNNPLKDGWVCLILLSGTCNNHFKNWMFGKSTIFHPFPKTSW